ICDCKDIKIKGRHNIANCLAVITACKILNIPNSVIISTLQEFELSKHRLQIVNIIDGVKYYDDSKSTNIHSTISACKAVDGRTTLLIGGYDKGLDYTKLFSELPIKINTIICFGANRDKILNSSEKSYSRTIIKADSLEDALDIASKVKCENVLFSPATSSFDRFLSYGERGEFFKEYITRFKH
ncbi:MAG: UDP-N-acetylmuramoyl-L-alanine--D-glutamate ligase, partial [Clostridia bacterium]|nr:UDP-N-acetylmuramoyl-L-alanine--D-glutamate ligase [Clostridia bacterium]